MRSGSSCCPCVLCCCTARRAGRGYTRCSHRHLTAGGYGRVANSRDGETLCHTPITRDETIRGSGVTAAASGNGPKGTEATKATKGVGAKNFSPRHIGRLQEPSVNPARWIKDSANPVRYPRRDQDAREPVPTLMGALTLFPLPPFASHRVLTLHVATYWATLKIQITSRRDRNENHLDRLPAIQSLFAWV